MYQSPQDMTFTGALIRRKLNVIIIIVGPRLCTGVRAIETNYQTGLNVFSDYCYLVYSFSYKTQRNLTQWPFQKYNKINLKKTKVENFEQTFQSN